MQHAEDVATAFGYRDRRALIMTANPLCGVLGFCQATAALAAGRALCRECETTGQPPLARR